jgi:hypothetical protein
MVAGCFFAAKAFGVAKGSSPTRCGVLSRDVCYLSSHELDEIQEDPKNFKRVFLAQKRKFISDLGPEFKGITEREAALAFAGVVAYELKAYRSTTDSSDPAPRSRNLGDLMAVSRLVCDEYVSLATQLFYLTYPQFNSSPIRINAVGWRRDSPVGNHAELFVTGGGVPLLVDPDLGLIARTTLHDVLNHVAVAEHAVFVRTDRPTDAAAPLLLRVRKALTSGAFGANFMIYSFLVRDVSQNGGPKYSYAWPDFTSSIVRAADGRIWYTTGAGALYLITRNRVERIQAAGVADVESTLGGDRIYALLRSGAVYRYVRRNRGVLVRNRGVDAIVSMDNGRILYLSKNDRLSSFGGSVFSRLNIENVGTGQGGVDFKSRVGSEPRGMTYGDRAFRRISSANHEVKWIAGKKGDRGCYFLARSGELWSIDRYGALTYLAGDVADVKLGVGGLTINLLKFDGTVWQGNLDGDGDPTGHRQPQPVRWSEMWAGRRFASIELANGGVTLDAMQFDGRHFVGPASTF